MAQLAEKALPSTRSSRHSMRLQELREAAAEIRKRHADGKISAEQAAHELDALAKRHVSFIDLLLW